MNLRDVLNKAVTVQLDNVPLETVALITGYDIGELAVQQAQSLIAAAAPLPQELGSPATLHQNLVAMLYQDDDAHDTCSLTACLNPLHPGPCKGWKGTLFDTAPGAFHALEKAKADKANAARVKKIADLKAKGLPIPKKLLTPIEPKAHPHAGKTANKASGEAHEAGKAVSDAAGVHVNEPGKVTLGQAIKAKAADATDEKGPKGKKPTVASKGIAHVIAQEKVTPQYKLDKAAGITPEQWSGLSVADKATIRDELAKIKKDGFGPQQKKATDLLGKFDGVDALTAKHKAKVADHEAKLKDLGDKLEAVKAKTPPIPATGATGLPDGYKIAHNGWIKKTSNWALNHNGKTIKTGADKDELEKAAHAHAAAQKPSLKEQAAKQLGKPTTVKEAKADGTLDKAATDVAAKAKPPVVKEATEVHDIAATDVKVGDKVTVKGQTMTVAAKWGKNEYTKPGASKSTNLIGLEPTGSTGKGMNSPDIVWVAAHVKVKKHADGASDGKTPLADYATVKKAGQPASVAMTPTNVVKQIKKDGSATLMLKGQQVEVGFEGQGKPGTLVMAPGGAYFVKLPDGSKVEFGKGEHMQLVPSPKPDLTPAAQAKLADVLKKHEATPPVVKIAEEPKALPAHVQHAISVAKGEAPGANWSKVHLAAYEKLTPEEFKALDTDVQSKIVGELVKAQSKFLDPKKKQSAGDLLAKFQGASGPTLNDKMDDFGKAPAAPTPTAPKDMSAAQLTDHVTKLLGPEATDTSKLKVGPDDIDVIKQQADAALKDFTKSLPPELLSDPTVAAKVEALKHAYLNEKTLEVQQAKVQAHLKEHHAASLGGYDKAGNKLTAADDDVVFLHSKQLKAQFNPSGDEINKYANEAAAAEAALDDAVAKAQATATVAEPVKLSDFDVKTVDEAYQLAWATAANKAATYGLKTFAQSQAFKTHPEYSLLQQDMKDLKALAGKLAVAHAREHTAELNVPTDPDTGAMEKGPAHDAWLKAIADREDLTAQFNQAHKKAQTRLDVIRTAAGLKKRALPKLNADAVKAKAAETGHYKSGSYGAPNYGKPSTAKSYMLAKAGPKIAVKHQSPAEKKAEKAGTVSPAKAASTPKIENAGAPVDLGTPDASIDHVPAALKKTITSDFKGMPDGKYLADPADKIFDNLVNLAAAHGKDLSGGLSVDQVLKTIDETHSKNLGMANAGMLHKKITDWLGTPAGKAYAEAHSTPDKKKVKQITGELDLPEGVTLEPGQKVPTLAGPGKHDTSIPADAFFPIKSHDAAAEQEKFMAEQGLKFTAKQKSAITTYTGNGNDAYTGINNYLRGLPGYTPAVKQRALEIQSAMMPLQRHLLLKRGTGWPPEIASYASHPQDLLGSTFEDKAFVSSTVAGSSGHFSYHPLQLTIEAPEGTPAVFVDPISKYKGTENEMLLAAGLKFKVLSVEVKGGQTFMRVRVVGDKTHEGVAA